MCNELYITGALRGNRTRFSSLEARNNTNILEVHKKLMKTCNHCQNHYSSIYKTSKFCSLSCANSYRESTKAVKFKFCKECKRSFKAQGVGRNLQIFCSHSCAAITNNVKRKKIKPKKLTKAEQDNLLVNKWETGLICGGTKYGHIKAVIRRYLLEVNNYQCCLCKFSGVNFATGNTILQIDHIDGDCSNHVKTNLRVLCPNCHAQTPTYGNLNKNSKRTWKKRYLK
jgi:5-methylcytosine-specific restriction endonuclease McrA